MMNFITTVIMAIVLSLLASTLTDYFYKRFLRYGFISLILMLLSMFGFPLIIFFFCARWYAYLLLGALLHKYFGYDTTTPIYFQSEFQRKHGGKINSISTFLFAMAAISLIFDLYYYFF